MWDVNRAMARCELGPAGLWKSKVHLWVIKYKVHRKHTFYMYGFSILFSLAFSNESTIVIFYYTGYKKIIVQLDTISKQQQIYLIINFMIYHILYILNMSYHILYLINSNCMLLCMHFEMNSQHKLFKTMVAGKSILT